MTMSAPKPAFARPLRRALLIGCALAGLGGMAGRVQAQAFDGTPTTQFGIVGYNRATPGVETVTIDSPTAVIFWNVNNATFLPAGNTATFTNGLNVTDFVVLNRLGFNAPVRFDGSVLSRLIDAGGTARTGGTVIFSAPNGLIVGPTGFFDVGSLVLTALNVDVDVGGNFYDAATRGITLNAGPSPLAGAAVVTLAGARLNALEPNSYVALIGPVVQHAGATRVNGSAAYVAGEVVQFRANQGLFDIIVTTGSANAQPLTHNGSTGGPASTGAGDNHAIYLVAMPKNQAITAVLSGDIGFDPAVAVGVENGVIVLSAGANVVGGQVDRYGNLSGVPAADLQANFEINGGTVRSDLIGVARTNIRARPQGGATSITFQQDVSLFGTSVASMSVTTGQTIDVLGNAIVSADAFDTITGNTNLIGGQAGIQTQGGTIHIVGTATVDASARGLIDVGGNGGSGTGGTAAVNAAGGGTIIVDGALAILSNGEGGQDLVAPVVNGGAGNGGRATLAASQGGTVNANGSVGMSANGTASASGNGPTQDGAPGTGGIVIVTGAGAGNVRDRRHLHRLGQWRRRRRAGRHGSFRRGRPGRHDQRRGHGRQYRLQRQCELPRRGRRRARPDRRQRAGRRSQHRGDPRHDRLPRRDARRRGRLRRRFVRVRRDGRDRSGRQHPDLRAQQRRPLADRRRRLYPHRARPGRPWRRRRDRHTARHRRRGDRRNDPHSRRNRPTGRSCSAR